MAGFEVTTEDAGRSDYQRQYEPMLYGWREGSGHYWCGARDQGDVWFIDRPQVNDLHPTMKPVALIERALSNSSPSGAVVLDPFGGAGSTLIACTKLGRQGRLIELDPRYVDATVQRWQNFTGAEAVLAADGRGFAEIAAARLGRVVERNAGGKQLRRHERAQSSPFRPVVVPVAYKSTKQEDSATQKKFHCLLKTPASADAYFEAIDPALQ
jgi:hypothetical protein